MPYLDLNAVQLRVTLTEIEPLVWRRLIVPGTWHLGQLHLVIQAAFNWWNYHLHEFRIGSLRYGDLETDDDGGYPDSPRLFDESEVRLLDFGREPGLAFTYLWRWCTPRTEGETTPVSVRLCGGWLVTNGVRASGCQHPVQDRHAHGGLGPLGSEATRS